MPARMPQPLGAVLGLMKFGAKHGLIPGPEKTFAKPHDERLKRVTPKFMCEPGPASRPCTPTTTTCHTAS